MKEKIMAVILVVLIALGIFAMGYRVAEMKYNDESIITVYNQD